MPGRSRASDQCDCGTCGPPGASGAAGLRGAGLEGADPLPDGAVLPPEPPSWLSKPLLPELSGATGGGLPGAGVSWVGEPLPGMSVVGSRLWAASSDSSRLVAKNPAAKNAVVRVSTLAVLRPVINPLVELTKPPPSDFCSSTTPI